MMTGRINGERIRATYNDLRTMTPMLERRMSTTITCLHCPQEFTDAGMWKAYSRHLKTEHR
jgi:hypothetical protein